MKEGWEVKKLGEVATFYNGYTPKEIELMNSGEIPYFKVSDMNHVLNSKYLNYTTLFLNKGCKTYPKNTIVFPKNGAAIATNKKRLLAQESVVDLNIGGVYLNTNELLYEYLYLYFLNIDFKVYTRRGAVPTLDIAELKSLKISIPPLPEQSRIVEELDQLSNIIEKKRQQLSELDNLAQSIFYDMFGDPVTNEKGWEVKKLGEVCEPKSKIIRANKQYLSKDKIRYIDISSIDNSCNTITHTNIMNFGDAPSRAQQIVLIGDVLVSLVRPNLRNIALISYDYDDLVASTGFCVLRTIEIINSYYLLYCVLGENFTDYLMERTSGANYPAVREEDIKGYDLCIPPLSLQQLFAQKIEAIEKEKELIKQSIKETEELFNSRMDYYFG